MKATLLYISIILITGITLAQSKYDQAVDYIQNKNYGKAIEIAKDYLSKDSTNQAIKIFTEITTQDTTNKTAYEGLGDAYAKMGVLVLALTNYDIAEKLDSLNIPLKFKIAAALYKQKSYTDAANKYLQIISIDSTNTIAYLKVGEILYYAKQFNNAAYYLNKFIDLNKKDSTAFLYTANSYYVIQNFKKAAEVSQEGLKYFPTLVELEKIAAVSLAAENKIDEALKIFNSVPDSVFSGKEFARVGFGLESQHQDSLALVFLTKALKRDTSLIASFAETVATMFYKAGNYDSAIVYYDKKISKDPTAISAYINKALCMIQLKNYDGARTSLLEADQQKSNYLPTLEWLGKTYQYMDSTDAAVNTYNKVIQLASADPEKNKTTLGDAYGSIALAQLLKKKYAPAIETLENALKYDTDNSQYHLWLAQALALTGKKSRAIEEYKKTLKLDPNNADAKKGLKILGE